VVPSLVTNIFCFNTLNSPTVLNQGVEGSIIICTRDLQVDKNDKKKVFNRGIFGTKKCRDQYFGWSSIAFSREKKTLFKKYHHNSVVAIITKSLTLPNFHCSDDEVKLSLAIDS
jgi:hypothetical protein